MAHDVLEGRYDKAWRDSYNCETEFRYQFLVALCKYRGDWKKAYEISAEWRQNNDSLATLMMETDLNDVAARMGNTMLERDNVRLELSNSRYKVWGSIMAAVLLTLVVVLLFIHLFRRRHDFDRLRAAYSEKNKALASSEEAQQRALLADAARSKMVRDATHDIETPIKSVMDLTQQLEAEAYFHSDEHKQMLDTLKRNATLLDNMLGELTHLVKQDTGAVALNPEPVAINALTQRVVDKTRYRCNKGVMLSASSAVSNQFAFATDPKHLEHILTNLISNAQQRTKTGTIKLHVNYDAYTPTRLRITVTDSGIGIPASEAESMFERYHDNSNIESGSDLSLSLSRVLAEKLGGSLKLDTSYTSGTRFVLEIKSILTQ